MLLLRLFFCCFAFALVCMSPARGTAQSAAPKHSYRRVAGGPALSVYMPLEGYADRTQGAGFSGVLWSETDHMAIDLRTGFAFDAGADKRSWLNLPFELGLYGKLTHGPITPFVGGGAGLSYVHERVEVSSTSGTLLVTRSHQVIEDRVIALPVFARVGVVAFDSSVASLLLSADYLVTVGHFSERSYSQAVRVSLGAIFGRGH